MPPPDGRATAPAMNHKARQKRVGKETGDPQNGNRRNETAFAFLYGGEDGIALGRESGGRINSL